MQRIDKAVRRTAGQAPVVPNMFPSLSSRQASIRRGEVSMIAGAPGSGKSTLATTLAVRAACPTLYVSADTHAHTMSLRLLAMLSGREQSAIEPFMGQEQYRPWMDNTVKPASHIRWCFDSAPSMKTIEDELTAFEELYGDSPDLVVIDNLTDIVVDGMDEWGGMRSLLKDAKYLARQHDSALLILHHTSEGYGMAPGVPMTPPRGALQGKVAQTPALILTVSNHDTGWLYVTPVKSRYGQSWPSGDQPVALHYNPAAMQVSDPMERDR